MAHETEDLKLDRDRVRQGVEHVLQHPEAGYYLVAEAEGRVVGQMMVTYEWSDWRNGCFWWIQSVFVVPAFRHRGLFKKLYAYVQERALQDEQSCGLRLYVERENDIAHRAYCAVGMEKCRYELFEVDFSAIRKITGG